MRRALPALLALAFLAPLSGCGAVSDAGGRLRVVATTTVLGDLARQVGGDDVQVTQLLRPSTDPHEYEPRPHDVRDTAHARIVLESGDGLDHWMGDVVTQSGTDARVLDLGARVPVRLPGDEGTDPHWWHDPRNAAAAARAIGAAFAAADPAHAAAYRARTRAYTTRVGRLDTAIARCVGAIPPPQRKLVTDHDAFGYLAHRFGLRIVGAVVPAQTTEAQPNAGDVADLVRTIRREHVRAVFAEHAVSRRLARAIARATGARADLELYGDTLGPADSPAGTYLGMERANADAIVRGLTGGRRGCS